MTAAESRVRVVSSASRPRLAYSDLGSAYASIGAERDWTVEGAIEGSPLIVLAGPEKRGKSWILADLARAVATGGKWVGAFEAKVTGDVVIIDGENGPGETSRRLARVARGAGLDPAEIFARVRHYSEGDLFLDHENEPLGALLRDVRENPPALIIVDPFRNFLGGADENSAADVIEAFRLLSTIRDAAHAPLIAAHHLNRSGTMSGSRAMKTRVDLFIEGSDEDQPSYSTIGRKLRTGDAIATPFRVEIVHEHDDDDTIATTRLRCRFQGENHSRDAISKTARRLLNALKSIEEPISATKLGTASGVTNGETRKRGLSELRGAGLATSADGKWSVSKREAWAETVEAMSADKKGDQDASHPY